jgi:hypothetical protein
MLLRFVDDNGSGSSSYNLNNTQPGEGAYGFDTFSITLSAISEPTGNADFDGDADVDGDDFLTWQRNLGASGDVSFGDADGNGQIEAADLTVWAAQFGNGGESSEAVATVPEPSGIGLALFAVWAMAVAASRSRLGKVV